MKIIHIQGILQHIDHIDKSAVSILAALNNVYNHDSLLKSVQYYFQY